jgi:NAD(P)H-flavin reductase
MKKNFKAKLSNLEEIAKDTYQAKFVFETQGFEFKAGQYVWVNFPELLYED